MLRHHLSLVGFCPVIKTSRAQLTTPLIYGILDSTIDRGMTMFNIDLRKYRIVDLSLEVVPPGSEGRPFEIERGNLADNTYMHNIRTHSHVGTHVESPAHFFDDGKDITQLPLTTFMGRAILVDITDATTHKAITAEYLEDNVGDIIEEGDIVVMRNSDPVSKTSHRKEDLPYLTPESAQWLADHRVKMLVIDNALLRLGKDVPSGRALHDILLSRDIPIVEFPDNLQALRKRVFFFMALPFKVRNLDSAWARAIAIEDRD